MPAQTNISAPSPALRSGSLRSPPLRAGEGAEQNTNNQQQKKSTKFISGLDLPTKNGHFAIVKGEGYMDIPEIESDVIEYSSKLDFELDSSLVGDSEMQHLDFAYASSLIRTFMEDSILVLTIRGRKYTPPFTVRVGSQKIQVNSVQTEVDAGYEGKDKIVLVEAKNAGQKNVIIRQLYYPFRQWQERSKKKVYTLFFQRDKKGVYSIWQFGFKDPADYNSIYLVKSQRFVIGKNPGNN